MPPVNITAHNTKLARVLHESHDVITIEVIKDSAKKIQPNANTRYLSMVFVHEVDNKMEVWEPWHVEIDGEELVDVKKPQPPNTDLVIPSTL